MLDRFRSPLLAAPPLDQRRRLRRRAAYRCLGAVIAAAVLVALAVPLRQSRLAREGPGHGLLWLHDNIYLPLKGYTFTLGFPISLTWWLGLLLLAVLGLVGFLLARPLTLPLHIWLIRLALQRSRLYRLLLWWCRKPALARLKLDRLGSGLIMTVVEHDRSSLIERLDAGHWPGQTSTGRLAAVAEACRLSAFAALVRARRAGSKTELLVAVSLLHAALLRAELHTPAAMQGSDQASGSDQEAPPATLRHQLEDIAGRLLVPLCPAGELLQQPTRDALADLGVAALASDYSCLLGISDARYPTPELQMRGLLDRVQARRLLADTLRHHVEQVLPFSVCTRPARPLPEITTLPPPVVARLAVEVVIGLAVHRQAPEIALAYLESLEALRFTLLAAGPERTLTGLGSAPVAELAAMLCHGLPRTSDYRICALLLNRQVAAAGDLKAARARASKVLLREDIELMRARINLLLAAAADPRQALATSGWEAE
jgi:hypothetical protein